MSLENTLERIAVALETIAQARAAIMNAAVQTITEMEGSAETAISKAVNEAPEGISKIMLGSNTEDTAHLNREFIKNSLRGKGIPFKEATRTENLKKLLDAAEADGRKNLPEDCACPIESRQTGESGDGMIINWCNLCGKVHSGKARLADASMELTITTKEQVRDALVALAAVKGKAVALDVLRKTGKAEKLADVDTALYGAIVDKCKEAENGQ